MSLIRQCQKKSSYQLLIAKRKIQKYFPELAVNKHILRCLFLGGHLLDAKKDVPTRLEQMKTVIGFEMGFKLNIRHILQQKKLLTTFKKWGRYSVKYSIVTSIYWSYYTVFYWITASFLKVAFVGGCDSRWIVDISKPHHLIESESTSSSGLRWKCVMAN